MGNYVFDQTMSRRVSGHFKINVKVCFDKDARMYSVINHNNNPVVWFRAFNAAAIKNIKDHLELRLHKHNMPPVAKVTADTLREKRRIARNMYEELDDRRKYEIRSPVTI